jgi:hypothetical protein
MSVPEAVRNGGVPPELLAVALSLGSSPFRVSVEQFERDIAHGIDVV